MLDNFSCFSNFQFVENILPVNKIFFFFLDLEDIRILTEKRLQQDGEKTKNPQQNLQLLDELIKRRLKPNESDLKIDALASKSKY